MSKFSDPELIRQLGGRIGRNLSTMREIAVKEFVFTVESTVMQIEVVRLSDREKIMIDLMEGERIELYSVTRDESQQGYQATFLLRRDSDDYAMKISCEYADYWTGENWHELIAKTLAYSDRQIGDEDGYGDWS